MARNGGVLGLGIVQEDGHVGQLIELSAQARRMLSERLDRIGRDVGEAGSIVGEMGRLLDQSSVNADALTVKTKQLERKLGQALRESVLFGEGLGLLR